MLNNDAIIVYIIGCKKFVLYCEFSYLKKCSYQIILLREDGTVLI